MDKPIPYGKQNITQADIDAVVEVLKSDYLTQGPKINEFEEAFAKYVGAKYAVAVANGTVALHLCTMALGVQPGDQVITTPITFAASANCVRYCGGEVLFADIDSTTYLLDINEVRKLLEADKENKIKGIIPVDFAGLPVDMEAYRALANEFGCWIIEDACHAPGGFFINSHGEKIKCGSGKYAELAIFSFHPVKHIAAGEGGMVTTNDVELYHKIKLLRTHGITRDQSKFKSTINMAVGEKSSATNHNTTASDHYPGWYMEMQELGFNYRLTDFQAALGLSQLKRAEEGVERRRTIANKYCNAFKGKDYIISQSGAIKGHAYHLYILEVKDRFGLYNYLRSNKVLAQVHYIPTHLMPYYRQLGWHEEDLSEAESYYRNCISIPMFPLLTDEEQENIISLISDYYG